MMAWELGPEMQHRYSSGNQAMLKYGVDLGSDVGQEYQTAEDGITPRETRGEHAPDLALGFDQGPEGTSKLDNSGQASLDAPLVGSTSGARAVEVSAVQADVRAECPLSSSRPHSHHATPATSNIYM